MVVQVTQFMRPNGRQVQNSCEVSDALEPQYKAILANKCRLTANTPRAALEKMIGRFKDHEFLAWLEGVQS